MKWYHDQHAKSLLEFEPGQKVLLDGQNLSTSRPMKKFKDKWFGPFKVLEKVGAVAYWLEIPWSWKRIHPVFNVDLLKAYVKLTFKVQKKPPPPPPIIVDDHEEFEVECILDSKHCRQKLYYKVKWKGYDEDTWEPASEVKKNAGEAVETFHRNHPTALMTTTPGIG